MKIIYNKLIPFKGFSAVNLFGVIFAREECFPLKQTTIQHERIHTEQMRELLFIGFYIAYFVEWLYRLIKKAYTGQDPYRNISFEREAYAKQSRKTYLSYRKKFAQWRIWQKRQSFIGETN